LPDVPRRSAGFHRLGFCRSTLFEQGALRSGQYGKSSVGKRLRFINRVLSLTLLSIFDLVNMALHFPGCKYLIP